MNFKSEGKYLSEMFWYCCRCHSTYLLLLTPTCGQEWILNSQSQTCGYFMGSLFFCPIMTLAPSAPAAMILWLCFVIFVTTVSILVSIVFSKLWSKSDSMHFYVTWNKFTAFVVWFHGNIIQKSYLRYAARS